jgi:integrase
MPTSKGKDGRWRYRFAFRGKRYSGSAPKGSNLEKVAARLEREHLDRLMSNRFLGDIPTVAKFVPQFLEYQKARVKPLTYQGQEIHLRLHTVPVIGKHKLDMVDAREFDLLVTAWKKAGTAARTINTRLGTVLRMFSLAEDWKMIRAVPRVSLLKIPHEEVRFLSQEEAAKLLEAAKEGRKQVEWYSMVLVGLRTGLRIGELRGLKWADISLERGVVHVQRTDPGVGAMTSTSPKSGKGRLVPLTPDAQQALRDRLAAERERLGKEWSPDWWIWPGDHIYRTERADRTRNESTCKRMIDVITKRAGLVDVGWHTLRHTFASWLVMRNVSLRVVQELLGHASVRMTEKYAHLAPGFAHAQAVASLDVPLIDQLLALPPGGDDGDK